MSYPIIPAPSHRPYTPLVYNPRFKKDSVDYRTHRLMWALKKHSPNDQPKNLYVFGNRIGLSKDQVQECLSFAQGDSRRWLSPYFDIDGMATVSPQGKQMQDEINIADYFPSFPLDVSSEWLAESMVRNLRHQPDFSHPVDLQEMAQVIYDNTAHEPGVLPTFQKEVDDLTRYNFINVKGWDAEKGMATQISFRSGTQGDALRNEKSLEIASEQNDQPVLQTTPVKSDPNLLPFADQPVATGSQEVSALAIPNEVASSIQPSYAEHVASRKPSLKFRLLLLTTILATLTIIALCMYFKFDYDSVKNNLLASLIYTMASVLGISWFYFFVYGVYHLWKWIRGH